MATEDLPRCHRPWSRHCGASSAARPCSSCRFDGRSGPTAAASPVVGTPRMRVVRQSGVRSCWLPLRAARPAARPACPRLTCCPRRRVLRPRLPCLRATRWQLLVLAAQLNDVLCALRASRRRARLPASLLRMPGQATLLFPRLLYSASRRVFRATVGCAKLGRVWNMLDETALADFIVEISRLCLSSCTGGEPRPANPSLGGPGRVAPDPRRRPQWR